MSRVSLASPYLAEHHASKAQRMAPPKDLLGWFLREFRAEMPDEIHSSGVWRDWKGLADTSDRKAVGGSLLGTPRYEDAFRRFLEDGPDCVEYAEYEGHQDTVPHYRFPVRAALASLGGRGKATDPFPFMARTLHRIALMDGDWDGACRTMGIPLPVRGFYIETALSRLWARHQVEPPNRPLREVDAA